MSKKNIAYPFIASLTLFLLNLVSNVNQFIAQESINKKQQYYGNTIIINN